MQQLLTKKFTVNEYHQMAAVGIIDHQEKVELIQGEIITMSPIGFRHASTINRLVNEFLNLQIEEKTIISVQNSIRLANDSEPQPDLVLLKYQGDFYEDHLPGVEDILLLIEVADSSLTYDQTVKIPLYAQYKIPEVWLINLTQNRLQCYLNPHQNGYQSQTRFFPTQAIYPKVFPELEIALNRIFTSNQ